MEHLKAGDSFGSYVVEGLVAGGGMGQVYAARHEVYGSICAMKVLHAALHDQDDWRKRFAEEGLVGAQLKHPHLLSAREIVEHQGQLAIIMDLVQGGQTLEKVMAREFPHGLPLSDALHLFLAITQGIEYLHNKGIVHGDLKPENVLIEGEYRRPETWTAKVTDFGTIGLIAHPVVIDGRTAVVATPRYASPEHLRGVDKIEPRSDVYCLGLMLHHLLSGEHVSDARTVREAAMFVMDTISTVHLVDQPEVVQGVFRKATAVMADERYPDCRALALAVRGALDALGLKLELADVAADLATEVDEERAAAQKRMNAAVRSAEDAPPLPRQHQAEDPDELPTDVDAEGSEAPMSFQTGLAPVPTPLEEEASEAPTEVPEPDTMPEKEPRIVDESVEKDDELEDADTGDSIVDDTMESPHPAPEPLPPAEELLPASTLPPAAKNAPISAVPEKAESPVVPLLLGIGIVLLLGCSALVLFFW